MDWAVVTTPEQLALWDAAESLGYRPPCTFFPQKWDAPDGGIERPAEAAKRIEEACMHCLRCVIFEECARAADAERAPRGVWAGRVFYDTVNTAKDYREKVHAILTRTEE